jgi:sugar/nucleoside kinase (ribokinase family)
MLKVGIDFADILKVSEEELVYITGIKDEKAAVHALLAQNIGMIMVTKGPFGTTAYTKNANADCLSFLGLKVIDTTGAGDACFGSFVWTFLQSEKPIEALTNADLFGFQRVANAVAGLSVTKRGGISSLPTAQAVADFIERENLNV